MSPIIVTGGQQADGKDTHDLRDAGLQHTISCGTVHLLLRHGYISRQENGLAQGSPTAVHPAHLFFISVRMRPRLFIKMSRLFDHYPKLSLI
jgi:hypothetical protein